MTKRMITALLMLASVAHPAIARDTPSDTRFAALSSDEYAWRKSLYGPGEDSLAGPDSRLPDTGPAIQAAKLKRWSETAAALAAIDPATLSPATRANYIVYRTQVDALLDQQRYRDFEKPLNADSSFWIDIAGMVRETPRTEDDYRGYLRRLGDIPRYYDQQIANMRAGLKRGFTPPRITLQGRDIGVAAVVEAGGGEASPFYTPFKIMPATIPPATQAMLRSDALRLIAGGVIPAHATLLAFLRDEYIPGARTSLAAYDLPDGPAYYRSKIREYVTRDLSAEQIHAIGLSEVARIRARMGVVMRQVDWHGDLSSFLIFLRTDPQFYATTPQALLDRAAWIAKTFDGKAARWFNRMPRMRFAIEPVPADLAPFYTGGRGGAGIYLLNTYNLPARPLY